MKTSNKRGTGLIVLLGVIILGLGGLLQAQAAKPTKLLVALVTNTSDYKSIKPLIEKYEQKTGIQVTIEETTTVEYPTKYLLAFTTGKPKFDVVMLWDYYTAQMFPFFTPLDGTFNPEIKLLPEDKEDFIPASLGGSIFYGNLYALPYSLDAGLFYYRTDLFAEAGFYRPPKTWDELVEYAKKLTQDIDGDRVIDQWGYAFIGAPGGLYNNFTFYELLYQAGGSLFDERGYPLFNSPAGVEALQFMVDLRNKYKVVPPGVVTYDNAPIHTGFLTGMFAMARHWPYLFGMAEFDPKSKVKGVFSYSRLPYLRKSTTSLNNWTLAIPKISERKQAAWDLVKFLTSKESTLFVHLMGLDWTGRKSAYEAPKFREKMPTYVKFFDFYKKYCVEEATPTALPRAGEVAEILSRWIDAAMLEKSIPKEALDGAAKEIKALY